MSKGKHEEGTGDLRRVLSPTLSEQIQRGCASHKSLTLLKSIQLFLVILSTNYMGYGLT